MSEKEAMPFEQKVMVSSSCRAPGSSMEAAVGTAGQDRPAPAGCALDEEVSDFNMRHVVEQDAQFFDG
jgi:hypothetical protein